MTQLGFTTLPPLWNGIFWTHCIPTHSLTWHPPTYTRGTCIHCGASFRFPIREGFSYTDNPHERTPCDLQDYTG